MFALAMRCLCKIALKSNCVSDSVIHSLKIKMYQRRLLQKFSYEHDDYISVNVPSFYELPRRSSD